METIQKPIEERIIYDLDELKEQTDYPVRAVCQAIKSVIEPMISDRKRLAQVYLGVEEMVKDVEVHGSESDPRLVIVCRQLGGVAIETIDKPKPESVHNGFGRLIIDEVFGDNYSELIDENNIFRGYLYINHDEESALQYSQIEHAA